MRRECEFYSYSKPWVNFVLLTGLALGASGQPQPEPQKDLSQASLEDLMGIPVVSVNKKEQKLFKAAAAVYVITQEDIRRSGATSIPDALRMAPGVDVARLDNDNWAIGIRGFNELYANKVLVMIDGRSVYSTSFSGVFWDQQDVPLETIERIEIIRGPGGTMWGANAVNGVINIITKSAKAMQGGLIAGGAGSKDRASGLMQYGGAAGKRGAYRVFGRYADIASSVTLDGNQAPDARRVLHGGMRADWDLSGSDKLTVQGNVLRNNGGDIFSSLREGRSVTLTGPIDADVDDIMGRWDHTTRSGAGVSLQGFYNYYHRFNQGVEEWVHIVDLDFEHHLSAGPRNDIVWGLGYRASNVTFAGTPSVMFRPSQRTDPLYSAVLQDEIKLTSSLALTVGSKFEHNSYTGIESEPSAQLAWTPTERQTLWASVARAIRQPSRADYGLEVILSTFSLAKGGFGQLTLSGNPDIRTETLLDFEAGYRAQVNQKLSLDVTAFHSSYRNLQTAEPRTPYFTTVGVPHLVVPLVFDNKASARNYGVEAFANWNVTDRWRISPAITMLNMSVVRDPSSRDDTVEQLPGYSPRRQYLVRSSINLPHRIEWDQTAGYTSRLVAGNIPGFTRLDTRIGWRLGENLDISVVGQNLLRPRHAEFPDINALNHTLTQRSVFARFTWRF